MNIQCRRLEQSLAAFALTCNVNGQIALKSIQQKKVASVYPQAALSQQQAAQAAAALAYQQAYQAQQQQQRNQQASFVAGGGGMPRTGSYRLKV